ncbi:hypothetical protein DFH06DRAFT_728130 [Mycena polygramma]|nr:hypothetical protein DFH06DRAFT_728130 [Mycena polygramma]
MALPDDTPPSAPNAVSNPYLLCETQRTVMLVVAADVGIQVTMHCADAGGFAGCRGIVDFALAKDAVCAGRPCAFGGRAPARAFPASAERVPLLYFCHSVAPSVPPPALRGDAGCDCGAGNGVCMVWD